ncbi:MAG: YbaB/EbfC family nucleoid-associated protein [Pseudomonadota bacterium]
MKDLGELMKQAGAMQAKMQEMQTALDDLDVEGAAGGGLVKAVVSGKGHAKSVSIDKSLMDPEETEVLEDLIVAALNDARTKAEEQAAEQMKSLTAGLPLPPGFKMPF